MHKPIILTVLFLVVLTHCEDRVSDAEPMTWSLCDSGTTAMPLNPKNVTLSPDPPTIGASATFTVTGLLTGKEVISGTIDMVISFMGVEIYSKSQDLCSKTSCPMKPGVVTLSLVEDLPPIAPPGQYSLMLTGHSNDDVDLFCLNVDFELVYEAYGLIREKQENLELPLQLISSEKVDSS